MLHASLLGWQAQGEAELQPLFRHLPSRHINRGRVSQAGKRPQVCRPASRVRSVAIRARDAASAGEWHPLSLMAVAALANALARAGEHDAALQAKLGDETA